MTRAGVLAVAVLATAALAPPAGASFAAPVQLATGSFGFTVAADAGAVGTTTVLTSGSGHGPRLYERPSGGAWSAGTPLPGSPKGMAGPVVDAAGDGALGIAWRVDTPRRYNAIAVAMRDPGGSLGEPVQVAGPEANGVRHPALAIDPEGDALLAYNTDTKKVHLSLRGAIAIAHREAGGAFSDPEVVDAKPSSPPAVAMARDGTGIVAWTHDRRVYAVSVSADGTIGKIKRIAAPDGVVSLVAAAGEDGAATLAWIGHHPTGRGGAARSRYEIRALFRAAGHAFGKATAVAATTDFLRSLDIAADEAGRVTLAWSREHFGDDRSVGVGGITGAILATTARAGAPFPAPRVAAAGGGLYRTPPAVAAAAGRVALTWGSAPNRHELGVQAAVGRVGAIGPAATVMSRTLKTSSFGSQPLIQNALAPDGTATVLFMAPTDMPPPAPTFALMASDGS
jgi:hypothetical protein